MIAAIGEKRRLILARMHKSPFRVLYREFLFRVVDLEILAPQGDIGKLLGQFAGLLIFVSFWVSFAVSAMGGSRRDPVLGLLMTWIAEHFLIATTMLAVGLFAVMSWETVFPDRRDVLVLSPLPVPAHTVLLSKMAAVATALGITVSALNAFTGILDPPGFAAGAGHVASLLRAFAAYWITQFAAGIFIFCSVLSVQGIAQLLPRQKFLRVSSLLQTAFFILLVTVYCLQPPFSDVRDLLANRRALLWVPSYWFFGLFHQLNGSMLPPLAFLSRRASMALGIALGGAAAAYRICYLRTLHQIAEQPDILPARRLQLWLPRFGDSLQTAVGRFSLRTLLRSRQHRVVLSFYIGIGLGLAMFVARSPEVSQRASGIGAWYKVNAPLLVGSMIVMCAVVLGTRLVFAMPLEIRGNWIFRMMPRADVAACLAATRRSLFALSVVPVWLASAVLFLWLWPWPAAVKHLLILGLLDALTAEVCLYGFHKVPFTCSYLPGKTRFNMAIMYMALFLIAAEWSADLEMRALDDSGRYALTLLVLIVAVAALRWRTNAFARSEEAALRFEEEPEPAVCALEIHKDGFVPLA